MAIEEIEFGEHTFGPARPGIQGQRSFQRKRLPHGPHPHAVGAPLALNIVRILVMMRLQRREKIEFEGDARMARRHDPMRHELTGLRAAEMAVEADRRARRRTIEWDQTLGDVACMAGTHGIMRRDPARCCTMARFASDAILFQEPRTARAGGRRRMAAETLACCGRIANPQRGGNLLAACAGQHGKGTTLSLIHI